MKRKGKAPAWTRPGSGKSKRCSAHTDSGARCKAAAVPGQELCISHFRKQKRAEKRAKRKDIETAITDGLHPNEKEGYAKLIDALRDELKPKSVADDLAIERMAMTWVQMLRRDRELLVFHKGRNPERALFYLTQSLQQWIKMLGMDRRLRLENMKSGDPEMKQKIENILKRFMVPESKGIDLERGTLTVDGEASPVLQGHDLGKPGRVQPEGSGGTATRKTDSVPPEQAPGKKQGLGPESGEDKN